MFLISLRKERCKASDSPFENINKGKAKAKLASSINWIEHICFSRIQYISGEENGRVCIVRPSIKK